MAGQPEDAEELRRQRLRRASLPDAAWDAAQELYRDENCRWFRISDLLPVYGFLCDFARGKPADARAERIARKSLQALKLAAVRVERDARLELPPEWEEAKKALNDAEAIFLAITQPHLTSR